MVMPTQSQQIKFGQPKESRLILILPDAMGFVSNQSFVLFCFPIEKFNNIASDNSMCITDMGFFVPAVPVLVNVPKRDQVPASF